MDRLWVRAGSNWKAPTCAPRGKCPRRQGSPVQVPCSRPPPPDGAFPAVPAAGLHSTVHTVSPTVVSTVAGVKKSPSPRVLARFAPAQHHAKLDSTLLRTHVDVLTMSRVHGVRTPTHGRLLLLPSKLPSRLDLQLAATKRCGSQAQRLPDQSVPVAGWATAPRPRIPCRRDKHPPFSRTCSFMKLTSDLTA